VLAARASRRDPIQARLRELEEDDLAWSSQGDEAEPKKRKLGPLARFSRVFAPSNPSQSLRAKLSRAGYHHDAAAAVYLGAKMLLFVAGAVGVALVTLPLEISLPLRPLLVFTGGTMLFFIPNIVVHIRHEKRRTEIRSHLPDAVDLLEICVSAGMGLDMAWNAVAEQVRRVSRILADEMTLTNLEMHLGASRTVAMRHMVERTGADELASLIAVLIQSERFGTSISDALRTFAASMRETRSQRAQEAAEKMAVKLLFPMVFFIFPAVLVVVAGPAGIKLIEIMGS
jgi:tight adherence protein C